MQTPHTESRNILKILARMWNKHEWNLAWDVYAPDYRGTDLTSQEQILGPAGVIRQSERIYRVFPDWQVFARELVLDDKHLALTWRGHGTHRGAFLNIPPTGKSVQLDGMSFLTLHEGKIQKAVHLWDMAAVLRTLGLLPELDNRHIKDELSSGEQPAM